MSSYTDMEKDHQDRFNKFPMFFAFSDSQFAEGMEKIGLTINDTDKIYRGVGGGFYKKTESANLRNLTDAMTKEKEEAIANDKTGEGFIFEMFSYELSNHEYCYTGDITDTLDALGYTMEEIKEDTRLLNGMRKAIAHQIDERS